MKGIFYASGVVILLLLAACNHPHSHDEEGSAGDSVSITKWTGKTELFVEFAPLLVGKETPFAAHLTDLATFKPVAEGTLRVSFTPAQGKEIFFETATPTVPGIYRPVAKIDQSGPYRLAFHRYRPGSAEIYDTIDAGEIKVLEKPEPAASGGKASGRGHHISQRATVAHGLCDRARR
jgi:hypothetical protein